MDKKTELDELAEKYRPTKIVHDYFRHYWRHLAPIRGHVERVLEIGVQQGRSLKLWKEFFPQAEIYGIDIDTSCRTLEEDRIHIFIGDSTQKSTAERAQAHFGVENFDVIIDDGAHNYQSQVRTFLTWFRYLKLGGIYVVEDVAQFPGYDRLAAVEAFTELIYGVNFLPKSAVDWRSVTSFDGPVPDLVRNVTGVSFYRYIIFVDKGQNPEGNRYLSDPAFNRLDVEAQAEQDSKSVRDLRVRAQPTPGGSASRALSRVVQLLRYRWQKQYIIGEPGKFRFLEFVLWRLRLKRAKDL